MEIDKYDKALIEKMDEEDKYLVEEQIEKQRNLSDSKQDKIRKLEITLYRARGDNDRGHDRKWATPSGEGKAFCYLTDSNAFKFEVNPYGGYSTMSITDPKITPKESIAWLIQEGVLSWLKEYEADPERMFDPSKGLEIFVSPSHDCVIDILQKRYKFNDKRD